jgi:hypothetical protein
MPKVKTRKAICPMCSSEIIVSAKSGEGDRVICLTCDANLEIVMLDPLALYWPDEDGGKSYVQKIGRQDHEN